MYVLYQISVRQATISLSLLLAYTSRYKPWESLWSSSATTPLVDFHHRLTACPSYQLYRTGNKASPAVILSFLSVYQSSQATVPGRKNSLPIHTIIGYNSLFLNTKSHIPYIIPLLLSFPYQPAFFAMAIATGK